METTINKVCLLKKHKIIQNRSSGIFHSKPYKNPHPKTSKRPDRTYCLEHVRVQTTLECLVARYYEPATAQFVTQDPMLNQTDQAYSYTNGNPMNSWDPSGMWGLNPVSDIGQAWNDTGGKVVDYVASQISLSQIKSLVTRGESYVKGEISHISGLASSDNCSALTYTLTGMNIDQSLVGGGVLKSMLPDYVVADVSFSGVISGEVEAIYSRYGQVYVYGAVGAAIPGVSVGLRVGYFSTWSGLGNLLALQRTVPTQGQLNSFLQGGSDSIGGYVPLAGIPLLAGIGPSGAIVTNLNGFALEIGIGVGAGDQVYGYQSFQWFQMSDPITW